VKDKLLKILIEIHLVNNNTKKVWEALDANELYTYTDLMNTTKLSRSTLYDALYRLEQDDFVERQTADKIEADLGKFKRGRPKQLWKLSERGELIKS
jgi:predicted ArsR family transcriptional regulator